MNHAGELLLNTNNYAQFLVAEKILSDEKFNDPDDAVFYEIALSAIKSREAYLVTGNIRHFPQKEFVVTPRDMLNIVLSYIDK